MSAPNDCFTIYHGKLKVNVPYELFDNKTAEVNPERFEEFKKTMMTRYPWLTENAMKVIINNAQREMLRLIEERREKAGMKNMNPVKASPETIAEARRNVEKNPDDYNAWMRLGELLCKSGETEEGYKAINKAKSLVK